MCSSSSRKGCSGGAAAAVRVCVHVSQLARPRRTNVQLAATGFGLCLDANKGMWPLQQTAFAVFFAKAQWQHAGAAAGAGSATFVVNVCDLYLSGWGCVLLVCALRLVALFTVRHADPAAMDVAGAVL